MILLLIGLEMLQAKRSATQEASGDTEEASHKEDAGIVPLGIPMLAGPGSISTVMVLVGQVPSLWHWQMGAILGSITATSLVSYWVLAGAERVRRVLGETGIRVLIRVMGLLLVALAMQFFVNGLTDLRLIPRQ
jgi:multiple antibiotic resistance protein